MIDLSKSIIYGTLPTSPLDARLKLSHIKDSLEKVLNKPLHYTSTNDPNQVSSIFGKYLILFFLSGLLSFALGFVVAMLLIFFKII